MMPHKQFVDQLFVSNKRDTKPIEYVVRYSYSSIVKHLFEKKEIQERFKGNDQMIWRLCLYLFVCILNEEVRDHVLSALQITKQKVIEMMGYKCPKPQNFDDEAKPYHIFTIIGRVVWLATLDHLKHLVAFIGQQALIDNVFNLNGWNQDAMNVAMLKKDIKTIEYLLSFEEIKKQYMSDNDLLFRLVSTLNEFIESHTEAKVAAKYIFGTLGLTESKLKELKA